MEQEDKILKITADTSEKTIKLGQKLIVNVIFLNISGRPLRFPKGIEQFENCFLIDIGEQRYEENELLAMEAERLLPAISFPNKPEYYLTLTPNSKQDISYDLTRYFNVVGNYRFRLAFYARSGFSLLFEEPTLEYVSQSIFESNWLDIDVTK